MRSRFVSLASTTSIDVARDLVETPERLGAGGREREVAHPPVVLVGRARDEARALEEVDHRDGVARVDADAVAEPALRDRLARADDLQDAVGRRPQAQVERPGLVADARRELAPDRAREARERAHHPPVVDLGHAAMIAVC